MTDALTLALDQLVDRVDDAEGNWDDVLRRAQPPVSGRRHADSSQTDTPRHTGRRKRTRRRSWSSVSHCSSA